MTTTERNDIESPATGLMIYNTVCHTFEYHNGTTWVSLYSQDNLLSAPCINCTASVCLGQSGVVYSISEVSGATSYTWTVPEGATKTGSGTSITVTFGSTSGNICVTANKSCGASLPACIPVTVNALPTVSCSSYSICAGGSATLSPTTGGTWTSSNTNFATVTNSGLVTGTGTGSATFTFTSSTSPNCSNTTLAVTVNALPTVSSSSYSICAGGSATLSPTTGGTWTSSNTNFATVTTPAGVVTGVAAGSPTFTFTSSTSPNCSNTTSAVTVNTNPTATVTSTQTLCSGTNTTLTLGGGTSYVWSAAASGVSGANSCASSCSTVSISQPLTGSGTVTYTVTATDVNGCKGTATSTVTVNAAPAATTAGPHEPSATSIVWKCTSVSGATSYKWNITNDPSTATITTTISYTQSSLMSCTSYTLYVWAVNACGNSTSLALTATTLYNSPCTSCTMTDNQGKSYPVVVINGKCWMQKNMDDRTRGDCYLSTPSYCDTYGRLYSWGQASGICPSGWRLPTQGEFSPITSTALTNGFNDLLGGRIYKNSGCLGYGSTDLGSGWFWTSDSSGDNEHYRFYGNGNSYSSGGDWDCYMESVRCVRN